MIAAAAIPAAISAALPYIAASTVMTGIGEYQRDRARGRAMKGYNEEVDRIGNNSMANVQKATQTYGADEMNAARAADQGRQTKIYEDTRLPDVSAPAISGAGAPRSVTDFTAGSIADAKSQGDRQFRANMDLGALSNALFGGQLASANAQALNHNNAGLISAREGKLNLIDLPQADRRGALWRMGGSMAGAMGNLSAANALYGGAARGASAVARGGTSLPISLQIQRSQSMGGIGTAAPVTVGSLARTSASAPLFRGFGGF